MQLWQWWEADAKIIRIKYEITQKRPKSTSHHLHRQLLHIGLSAMSENCRISTQSDFIKFLWSPTLVSASGRVILTTADHFHPYLSGLIYCMLFGGSVIRQLCCYQQRWKWVSGSWVTASDPLTHDEITAQILNTITRLLLLFSSTTGHCLAYFVLSWH